MKKFVNDDEDRTYYYGTGKEVMSMFQDLLKNNLAYSIDKQIIIDDYDYALLLDEGSQRNILTKVGYATVPEMTIVGIYEEENDAEFENAREEPLDYIPGLGYCCLVNWEDDAKKYIIPEDPYKEYYIGSPKQCIDIAKYLSDRKIAKLNCNCSLPIEGTFVLVINPSVINHEQNNCLPTMYIISGTILIKYILDNGQEIENNIDLY